MAASTLRDWVACLTLGLAVGGCGARTGLGLGTDGGTPDAAGPDSPAITCIDVPHRAPPTVVSLTFQALIRRGAVLVAVDGTGTMRQELEALAADREALTTALTAPLETAEIAGFYFADQPVRPYSTVAGGDLYLPPYVSPVRPDANALLDGVSTIVLVPGGDAPEGQVPAIDAVVAREVDPALMPACPPDAFSSACLPGDLARALIVLSDGPFHEGPMGEHPYDRPVIAGPTFGDLIGTLRTHHVRALGVATAEGEATDHLVSLARGSRAVSVAGDPVVARVGPADVVLGVAVVVQRWIDEIPLDVDVALSGGTVARSLVAAHAIVFVEPMDAAMIDAATALAVTPRSSIGVEVVLANEDRLPGATLETFPIEVCLMLEGYAPLECQTVILGVPGEDGTHCE